MIGGEQVVRNDFRPSCQKGRRVPALVSCFVVNLTLLRMGMWMPRDA